MTRETTIIETKLKNMKQKSVKENSECEQLIKQLIEVRFDRRNEFISLFHHLIRFTMLYRSVKLPR